MRSDDPFRRVRDIIRNIQALEAFVEGVDFDTFLTDTKTNYACMRALEIISEASRRVPDEIKARHPRIDWPAIAAAGNIYRHEYGGVDDARIWHTIHRELPPLKEAMEAELARDAWENG